MKFKDVQLWMTVALFDTCAFILIRDNRPQGRRPSVHRGGLQFHCRWPHLQTRPRLADLCIFLKTIARFKSSLNPQEDGVVGNERLIYPAIRACQFHAVLMMDSRS
jgi:hypothetical protein